MSSINGHLSLKTIDGWKFIDSTGSGGNDNSWDSFNVRLTSPNGVDEGSPKQLFFQSNDLGENTNLIAGVTNDAQIRTEITTLVGEDLLGLMDQLRTTESTAIYPRIPDNDGDKMPNAYETANGLDPNWPLDANGDLDSDGASNLAEFIAGTDPSDSSDFLHISAFNVQTNTVNVSWPSVSGRTYHLTKSLDLITWAPVISTLGTGTEINQTVDLGSIDNEDGIQGNLGKLFFRIEVSTTE